MKRLFFTLLISCSTLPLWAQVEKQVEVTKAYVPSLEQADKLAIIPDMTDTMTLRPEIDYTVTPLSLRTTLVTRPIRPAKVTYWNFNRPRPFYLRVGVGAPWQSVVDFSAATQNPGTGFAMGYLNHSGRYARLKNDFGDRNRATELYNRIGFSGGKYIGRHTAEANLEYNHRYLRRWGIYYPSSMPLPGMNVGYGELIGRIRMGDDFLDLNRLNFELAVDVAYFMDHSEPLLDGRQGDQVDVGVSGRIARKIGRKGRFSLGVGYLSKQGARSLDAYRQQLIHASARYGVDGERLRLEVGLDYYNDRVNAPTIGDGAESNNYFLPFGRLEYNLLRTKAFRPFVEVDGTLSTNDYRSLTHLNPFVLTGEWLPKSTIDYGHRGGIVGSFGRERFAYRAYVELTIRKNHLFQTFVALNNETPTEYFMGWMLPRQERLTLVGLGGEISYRPTTELSFDAAVKLYTLDEDAAWSAGVAELNGHIAARYEGRKIRAGVKVEVESERGWSILSPADGSVLGRFDAPFAVNVMADVEWVLNSQWSLFVEGRNLAHQTLYRFPMYRDYGIGAVVGARWLF